MGSRVSLGFVDEKPNLPFARQNQHSNSPVRGSSGYQDRDGMKIINLKNKKKLLISPL